MKPSLHLLLLACNIGVIAVIAVILRHILQDVLLGKVDISSFLLVYKYASENVLEQLEQLCLAQMNNHQFSDQQLDQFIDAQSQKVFSLIFLKIFTNSMKLNIALILLLEYKTRNSKCTN